RMAGQQNVDGDRTETLQGREITLYMAAISRTEPGHVQAAETERAERVNGITGPEHVGTPHCGPIACAAAGMPRRTQHLNFELSQLDHVTILQGLYRRKHRNFRGRWRYCG